MPRRATLGLAIALLLGAGSLAAQDVKVTETKAGLLKKAKITSEQAIATAKAKLPSAKLDAGEIEEEGGKLIYSFDFKTAGKTGIDEVNVDAMTGKVLSVSHETPEALAKEEKAEKDKAAAKAAKKP